MLIQVIQVVLILAPLLLGLSIWAYFRLRRHVSHSPDPIVMFRRVKWNSLPIVFGGVFVFKSAFETHGILAQTAGLVLALEFFYVAYVNVLVVMSARGILMGMRYASWDRFAGYVWATESSLELQSRSDRTYRFKIPDSIQADVNEIVALNILK